jgi:hypothetical protein
MEAVHWAVWNKRRELIDDRDNLIASGVEQTVIGGIAMGRYCVEKYQMDRGGWDVRGFSTV